MWDAILEIVCFLATQLAGEASASELLRLPEITILTVTDGKLEREICQKLVLHKPFLSKINFQCKAYVHGPEGYIILLYMCVAISTTA